MVVAWRSQSSAQAVNPATSGSSTTGGWPGWGALVRWDVSSSADANRHAGAALAPCCRSRGRAVLLSCVCRGIDDAVDADGRLDVTARRHCLTSISIPFAITPLNSSRRVKLHALCVAWASESQSSMD